MTKSGIIYPDPDNKQIFSKVGAFNKATGVYGEKMESFTAGSVSSNFSVENELNSTAKFPEQTVDSEPESLLSENRDLNLKTNPDLIFKQEEVRGGAGLKTDRNNFEMNINRPFSVKFKESPFKTGSTEKRKFSSDRISGSVADDNSFQKGSRSDYLLTIGGSNRKNDIQTKNDSVSEKKALRDTQIKNADGRNNRGAGQKNSPAKINRKSFLKFYSEKRQKNVRKDETGDRKKDSDGKLINLMFIFEIFRWFGSTDIIVRFIIGAIAGIAGFGYIFSQMDLLGNL